MEIQTENQTPSVKQAPKWIPPLLWKLLQSRNIESEEEAQNLFSPSLKNLRSPFLLAQMEPAIERLVQARKKGEQVAVYGDFDLDGTSGAALLKEGLKGLGFIEPIVYQPHRIKEGYGFHAHAVETLKQQHGVSLIVTVDVGITAIKACEKAKEIGIDVIITDHHLPKESLPDALAVINPNGGHCSSGMGYLAGTGVGYYVILGLYSKLKQLDILDQPFNPKTLLDFFVIGTITDMVPLIEENRILIKYGLPILSETKRPGLKALLEELNLYGKVLSGADVAIRFAPKLNALSRLEKDVRPIDLYLVEDADKAEELLAYTMDTNKERLSLQRSAQKIADAMVTTEAVERGFLFVVSEEFHKGVIGLVATNLSKVHGVPAFVGCKKDGIISGSSRAPKDSTLSVLKALENSEGTLKQFGGHTAAAGFEVSSEKEDVFRSELEQYFASLDIDELIATNGLEFDLEAQLDEIHPGFMKWYDALEPYGSGFEQPIFRSKSVQAHSVRELKGGHIKLGVAELGSTHRLDAIWFSPPEDHVLIQASINPGDQIDIYYTLQWNEFAGQKNIQLLIQDIQPAL